MSWAHTVWFEDARSADAEIGLVERFGLRGIFVWKLGGEEPDVWAQVS
jgi:spore germination protein YaaH